MFVITEFRGYKTKYFSFCIKNVLVDAGKATEERKKNLKTRAAIHETRLKSSQTLLKSKYGKMDDDVIKQLTEVTYIILDHIIGNEKFLQYLQSIFSTLQKYAGKVFEFGKKTRL